MSLLLESRCIWVTLAITATCTNINTIVAKYIVIPTKLLNTILLKSFDFKNSSLHYGSYYWQKFLIFLR